MIFGLTDFITETLGFYRTNPEIYHLLVLGEVSLASILLGYSLSSEKYDKPRQLTEKISRRSFLYKNREV